MTGKYDDIINLPRHVSVTRPCMTIADRAAQFSPFAALTGHTAAIRETARLTQERIELDEQVREILGLRLQRLLDGSAAHSEVSITYFCKDIRKTGGTYITVTDVVNKFYESEQRLVMMDGTQISIADIIDIQGEEADKVDDTTE